jgi:hypothetical protein
MNVSFGQGRIEWRPAASQNELLQAVKDFSDNTIVLGRDAQSPRQFYLLHLYADYGGSKQLLIGIMSEGHGLLPQMLLQPQHNTLVFGFNSKVVGIHAPDGRTVFEYPLTGLFYSFASLIDQGIILAVHELGALALASSGARVWSYTGDVITGMIIDNNVVRLSFMDGNAEAKIRLSDGTILP